MRMVRDSSRRRGGSVAPLAFEERASTSRLSGHIPALDGVRGLAILLVLVFHATQNLSSDSPLIRTCVGLSSIGWCGVDLFFVLSGFLITGILFDTKDLPHRTRNFYARRTLRIFPLYYGLIVVVFAALPWILPRSDPRLAEFGAMRLWLLLYGTNIYNSIHDQWCLLGHFWSLAVEEHFYLVWPAVIFGCTRKTAMRLCGVIVAAALVCRLALIARGWVLAPYCLTVCRMDALAIGSFLALAVRGDGGLEELTKWGRRVAILGGVGLVPWLCLWPSATAIPNEAIGYSLLDVFFAAVLFLTIQAPSTSLLSGVFLHGGLRTLGYSYGLYVFNSVVVDDVFPRLLPQARLASWTGSADVASVVSAVLSLLATVVLAWLSWHLFESRFLRLKDYFAAGSGLPRPSLAGKAIR